MKMKTFKEEILVGFMMGPTMESALALNVDRLGVDRKAAALKWKAVAAEACKRRSGEGTERKS